MKRLAILASGTGSNAIQIIRHFKAIGLPDQVALVASNKASAPVLASSDTEGVKTMVFEPTEEGFALLREKLVESGVTLIALAGFMKLVPETFLRSFDGQIVNIHPALLPKFGGPGMYGGRVHAAVVSSGEERSGCTIHEVNEEYDQGAIIAQFQCPVITGDDAETLAARVLSLEHYYYPRVLERLSRT